MKIWRLLWIASISRVVAMQVFREKDTEVVESLAEYFKVGFCVLVGVGPWKFHPSKKNLLTVSMTLKEVEEEILEKGATKVATHGGRPVVVLHKTPGNLEFLGQLSQTKSISSAVWIVFSDATLNSSHFRDVYVPFDCEFIYVRRYDYSYYMTEIYKIDRHLDVETYNLGSWTEEKGLFFISDHLYRRRNSLKGHAVTAIIKNNPPYVSIEKDRDGNPTFKGYLYEVWSELEHRVNFRTQFSGRHFETDPKEALKNEEVDFAVARISSESSDLDFMDFGQPVDEAQYYMFGHRPGTELEWDSYLKPFSANTWLVNLAWMLSSSLALTVLYKLAWDFGTSEREANYFVFTFSESLLTVFRAVCMQGSDVTPRSNSCRLLFLSIYMTALVVTSAFSAALFSLLTIPKPRAPFDTLDEVLDNKRFRVGLPSDYDFHKVVESFSDSLVLSGQSKLFRKIAESKEKEPLTPEEGLRRLCGDKSYIFVFDLPNVLYLMQNMTRACQDKILPSGPPLFSEHIALGFKKNNPYKELIDLHVIRMKNEGLLNRLLLNYWPPKIPTIQATWVRVTLADISPILYMFALGTLLGIILLYAESLCLRAKKKKPFSWANSLSINFHPSRAHKKRRLSSYHKK